MRYLFSSLFSDTEIKRIENCNKALEKKDNIF